MTTAAGRLTAMILAEAGTGSAGLRPRPRSRFHPPPDTAPARAGWDDLALGGLPSSLLNAEDNPDPSNGAQVTPDPGLRPAQVRRPIRWSPQRPDGERLVAGAADGPLDRPDTSSPQMDDEGDAELQLNEPSPSSAVGRRAAATGSETLPSEQLPAAPGPLEQATRTTRGARADDLTHHGAVSALPGRHERIAVHRRSGDHTSHEPPPHPTAWTGPHSSGSDQAMDVDAHSLGSDSHETAVGAERTAPVGALRPRADRTSTSVVRRRLADGDVAGGEDSRGEREVTVHVSIGRIEVKVVPEAPASRENRAGTSRPAIRPGLVTLEEYGARRGSQR